MKASLWILVVLLFTACNDSVKEKEVVKNEVVYDMYVPSEMSLLMKDMYAFNLQLKKDIVDGKPLTKFPNTFLNIHSAQLSNFKERTEQFKSFSNIFITAQKDIYNSNSSINLKDRFNNSINACISCHTTQCTGPIPKIKKLLIK